ncbi:hypothetical protein IG631_05974 [Alternaria alternata]|nr:hypothetical protein IG631_05974 [Alternaria alternata]
MRALQCRSCRSFYGRLPQHYAGICKPPGVSCHCDVVSEKLLEEFSWIRQPNQGALNCNHHVGTPRRCVRTRLTCHERVTCSEGTEGASFVKLSRTMSQGVYLGQGSDCAVEVVDLIPSTGNAWAV